jgi:hypothetical protein
MTPTLRRISILFALCGGLVQHAFADAYDAKPKLVVVLVFDQFRGDYLDRYRADFKAKNGWNLFLNQGAHFTDCYYDYANLVTAAGHATIGTGAYTDGHQIPLNEWYEPGPDGKLRQVSSVADDRYRLVGAPSGTKDLTGASAHREMASTLGDELVLATSGRARVYGVSMKDRAAILTSGHATSGAFWVDHETGAWETSSYWMKQLPEWASKFNAGDHAARARKESGVAEGSFYEKVGRSAASVSYQLDFAEALIAGREARPEPIRRDGHDHDLGLLDRHQWARLWPRRSFAEGADRSVRYRARCLLQLPRQADRAEQRRWWP